MVEVRQTEIFAKWYRKLSDRRAQNRIVVRIRRIELGHLGDVRSVGRGVQEIRINYGPGYRLYYVRHGKTIIILLCGGDKSSQSKDIEKAKQMADRL